MAFGIGPSRSFGGNRRSFSYQDSSGKKKEEEKDPTSTFKDWSKKTEGLREGIRKMGERESERKKKEEEEKKKRPIAPKKGFLGRMMDKYVYGKSDEGEQ